MKKVAYLLSVVMLLSAPVSFAEEQKCSVSKAEDLWTYGKKREAISCLDRVIDTDVTNDKAHFLKGKYCLALGDFACAKDRFTPGPVKAKYSSEIANLYRATADAVLDADQDLAGTLYKEVVVYNHALGKAIGSGLFEKGKLTKNEIFFHMAVQMDPTLNAKISGYYQSMANAASNEDDRVILLCKAALFDSSLEQSCQAGKEGRGSFHLEEAKKWARVPGKVKETGQHKAMAKQYLGAVIVDREMPEMKVFTKGIYTFEVKAGEQTPYWIISDVGGKFTFSSKDYNYKIAFDDGTVIKDGPNVRLPYKTTAKFRFIAITDQPEIRMELR